jgi:CHASE1-domain containing sensor protein
MTRLDDWIGVLAAVATILLSLAIAALVLERGSSNSTALSTPAPHAQIGWRP